MRRFSRISHAFTVDVEDWYHGIPVGAETKASAERRLRRGLDVLLELLAFHGVRGTFFWLGPVVHEYPDLVRQVAAEGNEMGCHGWGHELVYTMSREGFRDDIQRASSAISDITGKPVTSYRAPYFSITRKALWALEVLVELGFSIDSSIFPVQNWRYGIPDFEPRPQKVNTTSGPIHEFPISVRKIMGLNVPVSGGAYFRLYPYMVTRSNFRAMEKKGCPVNFYIHPWELDPDHPKVPFHWKARFTHYVNLESTRRKFDRLFRDFSFAPMNEILRNEP